MKKGNIYKGAISTSREEHVYILVTDVECGAKVGKGNYINFTSNPPPNFESTMTLDPNTIPDFWFKKKKERSYLGHDPNGSIYCNEIEMHRDFGSVYNKPDLCRQICSTPWLEKLLNDEQNSCGC